MTRAGLLAAAVGVGLTPLPGRAADPAARLNPASLLLPPVAAGSRADPKPDPVASYPDELPPRPARLKWAADLEVKPAAARVVDDLRRAEAAADRPPSGAELYDYLTTTSRDKSRPPPPKRDADAADRTGPTDRDRDSRKGDWFSGERIKKLFAADDGLFCGDHEFDQFVSPVSNPFLFEDPRSVTELRPLGYYQRIPAGQPNFQGGSTWFAGTQARLALTNRFSVTLNKIGAVGVNADNDLFGSRTGLSELWVGPKFTVIRNTATDTLLAVGTQFHIPLGSGGVGQNTGKLSVVPYVTVGKSFLKNSTGSLQTLAAAGYSISVTRDRSDFFYVSGHVSYDVLNKQRFFPLAELTWTHGTANGTRSPLDGDGRDAFNFGGQARGHSLLTGALGARFRATKAIDIGGAFELPLAGDKDFNRYRVLVDVIWRY